MKRSTPYPYIFLTIMYIFIQPDNILLMSGEAETLVKVTDFGVSKVLDPGTLMKTLAGTPCYIAPEVWKHQILSGKYSSAVDVWAVGIILYQWYITYMMRSLRDNAPRPAIRELEFRTLG